MPSAVFADVACRSDELGRDFVPRLVLVEPLGQVGNERVRDELRPIFESAGKYHVAPVAGPVLAVLRFVEQFVDDSLAFVFGRIEYERGDVLRRGNVADNIQPHAAEVRGVVDSRREFGIRFENFRRDELVDLAGGLLDRLCG